MSQAKRSREKAGKMPPPGPVEDLAALASLVPPDAPEPEPVREPEPTSEPEAPVLPSGAECTPAPPENVDPGAQPLPKEYVLLTGNASYGPVVIAAARVRALKDKLYFVPDPEERADILGTGRFRVATVGDFKRSAQPSAGPGGAITRDLLPPGAIKGGLTKP